MSSTLFSVINFYEFFICIYFRICRICFIKKTLCRSQSSIVSFFSFFHQVFQTKCTQFFIIITAVILFLSDIVLIFLCLINIINNRVLLEAPLYGSIGRVFWVNMINLESWIDDLNRITIF